ncbi:efflux RND transporter permease subunit, partial [Acinetobacter baumannii]|nr:efflux RND transporter permease subunit [Acinetobacter baumannii]
DRILEKFEDLKKEYKGVHFVTLMDQGVYIDLIVNSVLQNLLLGAVLAILILLVFLKSVRSTFVIACSIPISL